MELGLNGCLLYLIKTNKWDEHLNQGWILSLDDNLFMDENLFADDNLYLDEFLMDESQLN